MNIKKAFIILMALFLIPAISCAQSEQFKNYGKVGLEDFQPTDLDGMGYGAVILQYSKQMYFDLAYGGLKLFNRYHIRVKVLRQGFQDTDLFTVRYSGRYKYDQVINHRCCIYRLEDSQVKKEKIKFKNIQRFQPDSIESWQYYKLPELRAGDIVDLEYIVAGFDFVMPELYRFNHKYPCLKSALVTDFPDFITYRYDLKGSDTLSIRRSRNLGFTYTKNNMRFNAICDSFVAARTLPVEMLPPSDAHSLYGTSSIRMKANSIDESIGYTGSAIVLWRRMSKNLYSYMDPDNRYLSVAELSAYSRPAGYVILESDNWLRLHKSLYKHGYNFWKPVMKFHDFDPELLAKFDPDDEVDTLKTIDAVYKYMARSYKWNGKYSNHLQYGFRKISQSREGNSAEINMLLVANLRRQGIDAFPVLASVDGFCDVDPTYANVVQFNTVMAAARLNKESSSDGREVFVLLDAAQQSQDSPLAIQKLKPGELAMAVDPNDVFFVEYTGNVGNTFNAKKFYPQE